ncbi:MAG: hypothetical protein J6T57_03970 [Alphaproteobacteria bacterium]|nr:hypothetical protein [Alphaproteobacteria bacterium]
MRKSYFWILYFLPIVANAGTVNLYYDKNGACSDHFCAIQPTSGCCPDANILTNIVVPEPAANGKVFGGISIAGKNFVNASGQLLLTPSQLAANGIASGATGTATYACAGDQKVNSKGVCVYDNGKGLYSNLRGERAVPDDITQNLVQHKKFYIQFHGYAGINPGSVSMNMPSGVSDNKIYCDYSDDIVTTNNGCWNNVNKQTRITEISIPTVNGYRFRGYYVGFDGRTFYEYTVNHHGGEGHHDIELLAVVRNLGENGAAPQLTVEDTSDFSAAWESFYPYTASSTKMPVFDGYECVILRTDSEEIPTVHLYAGWAKNPKTDDASTTRTLYIANKTVDSWNKPWIQAIFNTSTHEWAQTNPDAEAGHGDVRYEASCNTGYVISGTNSLLDQTAAYDTTCVAESGKFNVKYKWQNQYGDTGICADYSYECTVGVNHNVISTAAECNKGMSSDLWTLKKIGYSIYNTSLNNGSYTTTYTNPGASVMCNSGSIGNMGNIWVGNNNVPCTTPGENTEYEYAGYAAIMCINGCTAGQSVTNGRCESITSGDYAGCTKIVCDENYHLAPRLSAGGTPSYDVCGGFPEPSDYYCVADN